MRVNRGKESPLRLRASILAVAAGLLLALPSAASAATCPVDSGSAYAATITGTAGLVSYWRLGESSGTSACDSYGANTGTYQGGFTLGAAGAIAGDPDTAVTLDGSSGTVSVPHSASLERRLLDLRETDLRGANLSGSHLGGVNLEYCDGSTRFVSNDVDVDVWRAAATRCGGETVSTAP